MSNQHVVVSSDEEPLILVDENDQEIGHLSKRECHEGEGILHRAFSIFLFNGAGDVLLQRRSEQKQLWPGYWSNACCSHPRQGESMSEAVGRRLEEELGVSTDLTYLYKFAYAAQFGDAGSERELCWVWRGAVDESAIHANANEVAEWAWLSTDELNDRLETEPASFTPWLKLEWATIREHWL